MRFSFRFKHYIFSAFRELFVHHHSSLEFRAKVYALIIAANEEVKVENYIIVKKLANEIYPNDEDRANLLMMTTKELVKKVKDDNGLDIDTLVENIQKDLKNVPRFAKKIDTKTLEAFLDLTHDSDTKAYQKNIIEYLSRTKEDILQNRTKEIFNDEQKLTKA